MSNQNNRGFELPGLELSGQATDGLARVDYTSGAGGAAWSGLAASFGRIAQMAGQVAEADTRLAAVRDGEAAAEDYRTLRLRGDNTLYGQVFDAAATRQADVALEADLRRGAAAAWDKNKDDGTALGEALLAQKAGALATPFGQARKARVESFFADAAQNYGGRALERQEQRMADQDRASAGDGLAVIGHDIERFATTQDLGGVTRTLQSLDDHFARFGPKTAFEVNGRQYEADPTRAGIYTVAQMAEASRKARGQGLALMLVSGQRDLKTPEAKRQYANDMRALFEGRDPTTGDIAAVAAPPAVALDFKALSSAVRSVETGGQPARVSENGAVGAMQLLPATAKAVAAKLGVPYDYARLLNDAAYNEQLGQSYLSGLVERYGGDAFLAVTAYHAGEGNVDGWLRSFGDPREGGVTRAAWLEQVRKAGNPRSAAYPGKVFAKLGGVAEAAVADPAAAKASSSAAAMVEAFGVPLSLDVLEDLDKGADVAEIEAARQAKEHAGEIGQLVTAFKEGAPLTEQDKAQLGQQVAAIGDPSLALQWALAQQKEQDRAKEKTEKERVAMQADPLKFLADEGRAQVPPLDLANPTVGQLKARVAMADVVAERGGRWTPFRADEQAAIGRRWKEDPDFALSFARTVMQSAGARGERILRLYAGDKEAGPVAHVAQLHLSGDTDAAFAAVEGFKLRKVEGYKPPVKEEQLRGWASTAARQAFGLDTVAAGRTFAVATAIFEGDVARSGGPVTQERFAEAMNRAAGATTVGRYTYGGITSVNGRRTIAPQWMRADLMDRAVGALTPDDLKRVGAGWPMRNGRPMSQGEFGSLRLTIAGPDKYFVSTTQAAADRGEYLPDAGGRPYVLDLATLQPLIAARTPASLIPSR